MQVTQRVKRWTEEENEFIKNNYLEMDDGQIAEKLNRTEKSVMSQRQKLDLYRPHRKKFKKSATKSPKQEMPSFEWLRQEFENRGYTLLSDESEYINQSSKLRYICNKHSDEGEQSISVGHFKNGRGCPHCGKERSALARKSSVTFEEDAKLCELKGFEYVKTELKDDVYYIYFICKKHRTLGIQKMRRGNMNRESVKGCQYCIGRNLPHWYVKDVIETKFPNLVVLSEFEGMNKPLTCYCKTHDVEFTTTAKYVFYDGRGCKLCTGERKRESFLLSKEEVESRILSKNPNVEILNLEEYSGCGMHMVLKCKQCGTIWEQPLTSIEQNSCRCPTCQRDIPIGEKVVSNYLMQNHINFIPWYKFDDCKYKRQLSFDFAIFNDDSDLLGLIEYQGQQHYEPIDYFGGQDKFEKQVLNDKIKKDYCKTNNIPLLEIPYWELNNIQILLEQFFNSIL